MTGTSGVAGYRVLVVEDELMIALDLCGKLENWGCVPVGPAASIGAALELLDVQWPDVALLDENMRGIPVTPVAKVLQERGIPFALVSGYNRPRTPDAALSDVPRVMKPASADAILTMLEKLTDSVAYRLAEDRPAFHGHDVPG